MDLPVYTAMLRIERRLYQVGDLELPAPVTLGEAAVFLASLGILAVLGRILGLGLSPSWAWAYLVLPWLAARASTTAIADRKRPHQWALAQLRHLLAEPRLLARLRPVSEPAEVRLRVRVWQPRRTARPAAPARRWHAMESLDRFRLEVDGREPGLWANARPASSSTSWWPATSCPARWPQNGHRVRGRR
jgi:hypothetical protein